VRAHAHAACMHMHIRPRTPGHRYPYVQAPQHGRGYLYAANVATSRVRVRRRVLRPMLAATLHPLRQLVRARRCAAYRAIFAVGPAARCRARKAETEAQRLEAAASFATQLVEMPVHVCEYEEARFEVWLRKEKVASRVSVVDAGERRVDTAVLLAKGSAEADEAREKLLGALASHTGISDEERLFFADYGDIPIAIARNIELWPREDGSGLSSAAAALVADAADAAEDAPMDPTTPPAVLPPSTKLVSTLAPRRPLPTRTAALQPTRTAALEPGRCAAAPQPTCTATSRPSSEPCNEPALRGSRRAKGRAR
jgi:hypothetical protein